MENRIEFLKSISDILKILYIVQPVCYSSFPFFQMKHTVSTQTLLTDFAHN